MRFALPAGVEVNGRVVWPSRRGSKEKNNFVRADKISYKFPHARLVRVFLWVARRPASVGGPKAQVARPASRENRVDKHAEWRYL